MKHSPRCPEDSLCLMRNYEPEGAGWGRRFTGEGEVEKETKETMHACMSRVAWRILMSTTEEEDKAKASKRSFHGARSYCISELSSISICT